MWVAFHSLCFIEAIECGSMSRIKRGVVGRRDPALFGDVQSAIVVV